MTWLSTLSRVRAPNFWSLSNPTMREHPGTMLKLTWLKLITFFRPDLQVHRLGSIAGIVKVVVAFSFWIWAALYLMFHKRNDQATFIIALTIAAFVLPHLVTISAPRYRIPIGVLCLITVVGTIVPLVRSDPVPA